MLLLNTFIVLLLSIAAATAQDCAFFCDKDSWKQMDAPTVETLLSNGADPNERSSTGFTPLYIAAVSGDADIARLLIDAGADVTLRYPTGAIALHQAVMPHSDFYADDVAYHPLEEYLEVIHLLLDAGSDVNTLANRDISPLYNASIIGTPEIIQLLLSKGANLEQTDGAGWTPLFAATSLGTDENVMTLLAAGARVNVADSWGLTPLHNGVYPLKTETIAALLQAGADINATTMSGETPLHTLVTISTRPDTVSLLLDNGADPNAVDEDGKTPLHLAARFSWINIAPLLEAGADARIRDIIGQSAFDIGRSYDSFSDHPVYVLLQEASAE